MGKGICPNCGCPMASCSKNGVVWYACEDCGTEVKYKSDKTEKLNSALEHTRKAMRELDDAASIVLSEHNLSNGEYDSLGNIYRMLEAANREIAKLNVWNR